MTAIPRDSDPNTIGKPTRMLRHLALPVLLLAVVSTAATQHPEPRVLVFSKTTGYRHSSIEAGIAAVQKLGRDNGFEVEATEDAGAFTERNLKRFRAVVFLNTTGDVLDAPQQDAFERFIQAGGGWVGVHSATDTEYEWAWYGRLAGAYFESHPNNPNVRAGTFRVVDKSHPSTAGFPDWWEREDEFYNFKQIDRDIRVLIVIDETTYQGGTNGARHPMSWYHDYDGGRAFYTNMGHTEATFSELLFLRHLLGGLRYAIGTDSLDYSRVRPEENRFTKVVLAEKLNEPVELAVLPDERVLFIERRGAVNLYRPQTGRYTRLATIPVSNQYTSGDQGEDGLLGLAADPSFATTGWIYLYYSPAGPEPRNVLARYTMKGDSLDLASRVMLLEVPVQREQCCHTGGSIAFDRQGNLYVSTGDNTNPFATGYAPIDERPGRSPWDAQKSSANTNDLRGKILRIHPEPNGSYTIPEGNLFSPGTPQTRPEIYTMGHRNPYRIAIDRRTGFVYWGDVGPDASVDSADRGPAGHDEIGQARRAGNFGWPHFVADNRAYFDVDFSTMTAGPRFDPARPINGSPNNTGRSALPPAQKALIWYPYGPSAEFPLVGTGGRTAMAGPVYYRDDFPNAARPFPTYYDGKLLIYEWMRGWIIAVTMDAQGNYVAMERFMSSHKFSNPMDMEFGPNGDLYLLEYGTAWFQGNDDARLVRIEYTAGNRKPVVAAGVDEPAGAVPLTVALTSAGTVDLDDDALRYEWSIARARETTVQRLTGPDPTFTFTTPGVFTASLVVTDSLGARDSAKVEIAAGNEPPTVAIDLLGSNRTFFFTGVPIRYAVRVTDREDGSLQGGRIPASRVVVTAQYSQQGLVPAAAGDRAAAIPVSYEAGRRLIATGTCLSCHQIDRASVGPSYTAVARRYRGAAGAAARLVTKIRTGGSGVWGRATMPAHPQITEAQASAMVAYILSLGQPRAPSLPVRGSYVPRITPDSAGQGVLVLRAAYTDRGANGIRPARGENTVVLRAPVVVVSRGGVADGIEKYSGPEVPVEVTIGKRSGAFVGFEQLDLTGVSAIDFTAIAPVPNVNAVGGAIEVRLDSATGPLLGESARLEPQTTLGAPSRLRVPLERTSGMHDVYFVFRNAQAKEGENLFVLFTAAFVRSTAAR
ncbi:MAG: ThuA domain-containing protein [Gemmatimonadaceae bacterium]